MNIKQEATKQKCVLWNKGVQPIISKKLVFCELKNVWTSNKKQQNKMCIVEQRILQ
jgi:hypothetical protein